MKTTYKYLLAAACAAPIILSGCQQEIVPESTERISVRIADDDAQTRTTYDNLQGKFAWSENDEIALYLKDLGYETFALTVDASDPAQASILSSSVGTHLRDGYAIYPATAAVNPATGDTAPKVLLPSEYDLPTLVDAGEDFSPAVLLAKNEPGEDLAFYHAGGLVRFVLTDVASTTTKVVVTFDKNVTGEFDVITNDANEPVPYIQTQTGDNTSVTFTVSSDVINSDGSLELNLPVPCGTYDWVQVELFAGTTSLGVLEHTSPLEFARHHGKRVGFAETEYELIIGSISVPSNSSGSPLLTNEGGIITLAPSFVSYKTDGENEEPVPFHLEYSTNGSTWTTDIPDWISFAGTVDPDGSVPEFPQELSVVIDPLKNQIPVNAFGVPIPEGSHSANLHNTPDAGVVDLSTINVATGQTVARTTANCYVVKAPGTYTFPFVYGNAIKDGNDNPYAYRGMMKNAVTGKYKFRPDDEVRIGSQSKYQYSYWLGRFQDHLGGHIEHPYISDQLEGGNYEARILWMDQPGLIESVSFNAGGAGGEDDYIQFVVSQDGIAQGNALIGVIDDSGSIVWSWHIWITDEDMTQTQSLKGVQMAPVNLGWCNKVMIEQYKQVNFYLRVKQDGVTGAKESNRVRVYAGTTSSETRYGNAPYYNGGRKDPIVGYDGNRNYVADKPVYPTRAEGNNYYPQFALLDLATLAGTIQHPYIHYYPESDRTPVLWMDKSYGNLWNSTQSIFEAVDVVAQEPVTKTIYDPSPVGYRVPGVSVFIGINYEETTRLSNSQTPDGLAAFQIDEVLLYCMGYRELYLHYVGSNVYSLSASTLYSSNRIIHTRFHINPGSRTVNNSVTVSCTSLRPTVDIDNGDIYEE